MTLPGKRNWYLPNWLGWLPKVNIEGAHLPHPHLPTPAPSAAPTLSEGGAAD